RELPLGDRQLALHLGGERADVGPGARRLRHLLEGYHQGSEVAVVVTPLVQAEQVRDRLRLLQAGEQSRLERGRRLVERRGGDSKRGEQEKAVHAFGLPRGSRASPPTAKQRRVGW